MISDDRKKLRAYYRSLRGQQRVFDDAKDEYAVPLGPVEVLRQVLRQLEAEFPGLVPSIEKQAVYSHEASGRPYFNVAAVRSHIANVIGILEAELDSHDSAPVIGSRSFSFIANSEIREVVERDYVESQRAYVAHCWKSVIILAGGMIEAILIDLLSADGRAMTAERAPQSGAIDRWGLKSLIDVAVELKLVSAAVEKLSHPIREYRNLVHPGNELRNRLTFGAEEAKIAVEVLNILYRDLNT